MAITSVLYPAMAVQLSKRVRWLTFSMVYCPGGANSLGYYSYAHILDLRHQITILVTPQMCLPISTTTNRELLNSQTLYNNIICIAVGGGMMVCGDAN